MKLTHFLSILVLIMLLVFFFRWLNALLDLCSQIRMFTPMTMRSSLEMSSAEFVLLQLVKDRLHVTSCNSSSKMSVISPNVQRDLVSKIASQLLIFKHNHIMREALSDYVQNTLHSSPYDKEFGT